MEDDDPITILTEEHKVILKVVTACGAIREKLNTGRKADVQLLVKIVEFMQEFADKCHHTKEEDLLFPAFEKAGVPSTGCPLEALRAEHKNGRKLVMQLNDSANRYMESETGDATGITNALAGIGKLYPNHIWKEDAMVFPMVGRLFSPERRKQLLKAFEEVEAKMGHDVHRKFVSFAEEISDVR